MKQAAKIATLLAVLTITACGPKIAVLYDRWTVDGLAPEGLDVALAVARDLAPCDLPAWGGTITFREGVVDCYGVPASGCWRGGGGDEYRLAVEVSYSLAPITGCSPDGHCVTRTLDRLDRTAFFHEVMHFVAPYCGAAQWFAEPPPEYETAMNAEWRARMEGAKP